MPDDLDYASPQTRSGANGRPLRKWIILLAVWAIGLVVWAAYLVAIAYLTIRFL